jgi:serine/threonine protein kinase
MTNGRSVAIKKVSGALEDARSIKRLLREIRLLRHFNHENVPPPPPFLNAQILKLVDLMGSPLGTPFKDLSPPLPAFKTHVLKVHCDGAHGHGPARDHPLAAEFNRLTFPIFYFSNAEGPVRDARRKRHAQRHGGGGGGEGGADV